MTDKTEKKTEPEKIVQVETKSTPEVIPVADRKTAAKDMASPKAPEPMLSSSSATGRDASSRVSNSDTAKPAAAKPFPQKAATGGSGGGTTVPPVPPAPYPANKGKSFVGPVVVTAIVIAALAGATIWYLHQQNLRDRVNLGQQLQANIQASHQAGEQAQQALALLRKHQQKLQSLEQQLADTREQASDLNQAFQTLTDAGTEVILLNDIDHLVTIAQQQLLLGGNIANAIVSLETAQARLARANRPTLASLQQTINGDVERLRATVTTDVPSLSRQLDLLSQQLNKAPLLMPDDVKLESTENTPAASPAPSAVQAPPVVNPDDPWWKRTGNTALHWIDLGWAAVRHDLGDFITIRRVDDASALLLSPEQASRFRDNLRLRVSSAKLALLTNQPTVWAAETEAIVNAIEQRFDMQAPATAMALHNAVALSRVEIVNQLPNVDNSLSAIEALLQGQANKTNNRPDSNYQSGAEAPDSPPSSKEGQSEPASQDSPSEHQTPASTDNAEASGETQPEADNVQATLQVRPSYSLRAEPVVYLQE